MDVGNKIRHWEKESLTQPTKTTIFNQVIGNKTYVIEMPQSRVVSLIDRVDKFLDKQDTTKAKEVIEPYIVKRRKKKV